MAFDLTTLDNGLAQAVAVAIHEDPGLPFAPFSRQYKQLVEGPCEALSVSGPKVFVIDALDEQKEHSLLNILCEDVPKLPSNFCFFITSRTWPGLDRLRRCSHVTVMEIDITTQENSTDIAKIIDHELQLLAKNRGFIDNWPGEALRNKIISKAGGLPRWVNVVFDHLRYRDNPTEEIMKIVLQNNTTEITVEARLHTLYASILEYFDWSDQSFVDGYRKVVRIVLAAKVPLTISVMNGLSCGGDDPPEGYDISSRQRLSPIDTLNSSPIPHPISGGQNFVSNYTLQALGSLLTGTNKLEHGTQPVRLLHPSLRDFLTARPGRTIGHAEFHIQQEGANRYLAILCLKVLNQELTSDLPVAGYLSKETTTLSRIPLLKNSCISEALWYACRFWAEHIYDAVQPEEAQPSFNSNLRSWWTQESLKIGDPVPLAEDPMELIQAQLLYFLGSKLVLWLEVIASSGMILPIHRYCKAITKALGTSYTGALHYKFQEYRKACLLLGEFLSYEARTEESAAMVEEGISWPSQVLEMPSLLFKSRIFPYSSNARKSCATTIHKELVMSRPSVYTLSQIAGSLERLSTRLACLRRDKEAVPLALEAMKTYRRLAEEQPDLYKARLSHSLGTYFFCFMRIYEPGGKLSARKSPSRQLMLAGSMTGHSAIYPVVDYLMEAVATCSQLEDDQLETHTSSFVSALIDLSEKVAGLYLDEEAIIMLHEAALCRNLSRTRLTDLHEKLTWLLGCLRNDDPFKPKEEPDTEDEDYVIVY
ncbi:hypothetical protein RhiJN_25984 [Ceratobasidium sp. AG-Ba]|nr:hypothetical protein RhiJN_25984 [Ceratobasidium sp. AG-Ba]